MPRNSILLLALSATLLVAAWAQKPALKRQRFGVNIHFTSSSAGVVTQLSSAFKVARMDYNWARVEGTPGAYDFSAYDGLLRDLKQNGVQPYWILDYGNPHYDNGQPPRSPAALEAFAKFAVASIDHFKGNEVIWELWNEPNGGFWPPKANATEYAALALAVGKALYGRSDLSGVETLIGPATAGIDQRFLETVFQLGVLEYFDAVSVHPYRQGGPETVVAEYDAVAQLIAAHAPKDRPQPPIVSGEWGWSTCHDPQSGYPRACTGGANTGNVSLRDQAKYLARQWLVNAWQGAPVSIYYDFVNDGTDPTQGEQNFGSLFNGYQNASEPYRPKPSFHAAVVFQQHFGTFAVTPRRVPVVDGNATHYALHWSDGNSEAWAVWKTDGEPLPCSDKATRSDCGFNGISQQQCEQRGCCFETPYVGPGPQCYYHNAGNTTGTLKVPVSDPSCLSQIDFLGNPKGTLCPKGQYLEVTTSDEPVYLIPQKQ
eukprot:TRINITY_DN71289_c0_g1_i1.p1 TRINITY_DN71289_c0_g1~~TRINITY_DN71289_c0_g1_i1.p1  ORF type:complete len:485 (-),score=94.64 TRINITY_DN71289_c0_g1_i1:111-1565(-)